MEHQLRLSITVHCDDCGNDFMLREYDAVTWALDNSACALAKEIIDTEQDHAFYAVGEHTHDFA